MNNDHSLRGSNQHPFGLAVLMVSKSYGEGVTLTLYNFITHQPFSCRQADPIMAYVRVSKKSGLQKSLEGGRVSVLSPRTTNMTPYYGKNQQFCSETNFLDAYQNLITDLVKEIEFHERN